MFPTASAITAQDLDQNIRDFMAQHNANNKKNITKLKNIQHKWENQITLAYFDITLQLGLQNYYYSVPTLIAIIEAEPTHFAGPPCLWWDDATLLRILRSATGQSFLNNSILQDSAYYTQLCQIQQQDTILEAPMQTLRKNRTVGLHAALRC